MNSVRFDKLSESVVQKGVIASVSLTLLLVLGSAGSQVQAQSTGTIVPSYTFNPENFLVPPVPERRICGVNCGGEIFLRMGEPVIADDIASIGIWLRVEPSTDTVTPYLGNYTFHVAVGGSGITLGRTECTFEVASGVQPAYNPSGLAVGTTDPLSITVSAVAPGFGARDPSAASHYTLKTEFEQFGTFSCPIADSNRKNAYVLTPSNVFGFTIQAGSGGQRELLLRADNSYQYYPLDGSRPFVAGGSDASTDRTTVTISIKNNIPDAPATATNFVFGSGCSSDPVVSDLRLTGSSSTNIELSFSESQATNDCYVDYDVVVPGNIYTIRQDIGSLPGQLVEINVLLGGGVRGQQEDSTPYMTVDLSENNVLPISDPYCGQYPDSLKTILENEVGRTELPGGCVATTLDEVPFDGAPNFTAKQDNPQNPVMFDTVGVVDWVLVEVRTADTETATSFTAETVIAQLPALLLSNGTVVDGKKYFNLPTDDERAICASVTSHERSTNALVVLPGQAFSDGKSVRLVIRHRNHLDIMSAGVVQRDGDVSKADFTSVESAYTPSAFVPVVWNYDGGLSGDLERILLPYPNHTFMVPGDTDGNGRVEPVDVTGETGYTGAFFRGVVNGYQKADTNLNNVVEPNDVTERGYTTAFISGVARSRVPE